MGNYSLSKSIDQLKQTLEIFQIEDILDSQRTNLYLPNANKEAASTDKNNPTLTSSSSQPPIELASLAPLALFCNSLITAMNDLRCCCPSNLANYVGQSINDIMSQATKMIKNWIL